ncbi:MAG: hypothetical protein MHM6MM_003091 [Cercozoa sp. M6MM]
MAAKLELLFALSSGGGIDIWDLHTGAYVRSIEVPLRHFALRGDAHLIGVASDKPTLLQLPWRRARGKKTPTEVSPIATRARRIAVSHSAEFVVVGDHNGELLFFDGVSGGLLRTVQAHFGAVTDVRFVANDAAVLSSAQDGSVKCHLLADLLHRETCEPFAQFSLGHAVHALATHNTTMSAPAFACCADGIVRRLHLPSAQLVSAFACGSVPTCASLCPSGETLLLGTDKGALVRIDLVAASPVSVQLHGTVSAGDSHKGHTAPVSSICHNTDGSLCVTAGMDGTARVWNLQATQPQCVRVLARQRAHYAQVRAVCDIAGLNDAVWEHWTPPALRRTHCTQTMQQALPLRVPHCTSDDFVWDEDDDECDEQHSFTLTDYAVHRTQSLNERNDTQAELQQLRQQVAQLRDDKEKAERLANRLHAFCAQQLLQQR